jgi:hypothetical protein
MHLHVISAEIPFMRRTADYTLSDHKRKSEITIIINFANSIFYTTVQIKLERTDWKNEEGSPEYLQSIGGRWWLQKSRKC